MVGKSISAEYPAPTGPAINAELLASEAVPLVLDGNGVPVAPGVAVGVAVATGVPVATGVAVGTGVALPTGVALGTGVGVPPTTLTGGFEELP
jgi:hypothetical protein